MNVEPPFARRDLILQRLEQGQPVAAGPLAVEFQVSEDAIRRDLRALAAEGRCRRVYGGALPMLRSAAPMVARLGEARDRKRALARKAASLIERGQFIFLDSGSANLALIEYLPDDFGLTVATNSVDIAAAALRRPGLKLIMVGGAVSAHVGGCVDAEATSILARLNIDLAVLGACAASASAGVCAQDASDAAFKRALVSASETRLVLAVSEKLGARAPHRVAELKDIDAFVVEPDADIKVLADLAAAGCKTLVADSLE